MMEENMNMTGKPADQADNPVKKKSLSVVKRELEQIEKNLKQKQEQAEQLAAEISELDAKRNALKKTVCELETDALTVTVRKLLLDGKLAPHDVMQLVNEAKQSKAKRKKAEAVVTASDTPDTEES